MSRRHAWKVPPLGLLPMLLWAGTASAQLPWSDDTHQIAFGDFNGDGRTDLLFVARSAAGESGIALSNNAGPYNILQTWPSNHLGIAWSGATYLPVVADFNGDGRADILMQRQSQGDHYLLLIGASGQIDAITQTLAYDHGGQIWSADAHRIVAGDFNGDGRADVFLQSKLPSGLNAVFLAGGSGAFGGAQQSWANTHIGFRWSLQNALVHAGDFNGDGKADLFVQAKQELVLIDFDVPFLVPTYRPGSFGVASAKTANGNGEIFYAPALQIWDRRHLGVDWSATSAEAVVGDFNGDGRADIFLQGRRAGSANALLQASAAGQFTSGNSLTDPTLLVATGDQFRLYAANFDGTGGAGMFAQALTGAGTSSISWNSTSTASWADAFEYDALGRLRKVTYQNGAVTTYTLDSAGNRHNVTTTTP